MNRAKWFLLVNAFLAVVLTIGTLFWSRSNGKARQSGSRETAEHSKFLKETILLDSLFRNYKATITNADKAQLIDIEMQLRDQMQRMQAVSEGGSATHAFAAHLVRNYARRVHLVNDGIQAKQTNSNRLQLLSKQIAILEKSNQETVAQNQLIQQAILNAP